MQRAGEVDPRGTRRQAGDRRFAARRMAAGGFLVIVGDPVCRHGRDVDPLQIVLHPPGNDDTGDDDRHKRAGVKNIHLHTGALHLGTDNNAGVS